MSFPASWRRAAVPFNVVLALTLALTGMQFTLLDGKSYAAASTVRINAGGPTQTVNGTTWSGCTSTSACNGYVSGGFPWAQQPAPAVSGYPADTNAAIHQTEWTGGQTNGVPAGATAFSFNVPVNPNNDYDVVLQFTELNKTAPGARLFDVKIDGTTKLSNFDVYAQAGGLGKTIVRSFRVFDGNGQLNIEFVRRLENAKVDAIAILPAGTAGTTTTTAPGGTTTSTTAAPPSGGTNVAWSNIALPPYRTVEAAGGLLDNKIYQFGGFQLNSGFHAPTNTSTVYDIATNKWSYLPSVPRGLTHSARIVDGRRFILLGGVAANSNGSESFGIRTVFTYNVDSKQWGYLPDLPAARGSGGAALFGRELHFFGGIDTNKAEKTDHWYLDLNNTAAGWKAAPSIPVGRSHFAAVQNGNQVYTIGGMTGWEQNTVERSDVYRYDNTTKTWTRRADLPVVRSHIGESSLVINGRIWVIGGEPKYPDSTREIWTYNLSNNTWSKAAGQLPAARFSGIATYTGNTLYFFAGSVYQDGAWKGSIY